MDMAIENIIRETATSTAPLINHLLVATPFETDAGLDFGWFCREHAIITKLLLGHSGISCQIFRGHVTAYVAGIKRLTTTGTDTDHAWCAADSVDPLDLSMTYCRFTGFPQLEFPVVGTGKNGEFEIAITNNVSEFPRSVETSTNAVYFAAGTTLSHSCEDLIRNPTLLVDGSEAGAIALAITAYIDDLANQRTKHLFHGDTTQEKAVSLLLSKYSNPRDQLLAANKTDA